MAPIRSVVDRPSRRYRGKLAWGAPVLVAGAIAAGSALTAAASNATPNLPARTPAQLLTAVQRHAGTPLSGQITETANLGFPSLPGNQAPASLSWQSFVTGSHSARVWSDGPSKQRVALLGELSEADVTHNGKNLWTYTSDSNTVSHVVLGGRGEHRATSTAPDATDLTPAQVSAKLLKAVNPSTAVSVDNGQRVAGRAAYTLVLHPRDKRSTVREVRVAIDATKYVPLKVQIFGAGTSPAFQVGFSDVSFARPAASVFDFKKPAGATVTNDPMGTREQHWSRHDGRKHHVRDSGTMPMTTPRGAPTQARHGAKVIGSGWTSVLEVNSNAANGIDLNNGVLGQLTTSVGSSGQRLLHTALLNAVVLPDGRAFVGAVRPSLLEHIAATH
jgi:outer membrane lipoprotein-sorting protein